MKKVNEILTVVKKHIKFVVLYFITLTAVCFIFLTELEINRKVSFSGYCVLGSVIALVALLDDKTKSEYDEGFEVGNFNAESYWKSKYTKLARKLDDGFILPIRISDNYKILSLEKVGERQFYDSTWEITGIYNKLQFYRCLTRMDGESFIDIIEELKKTTCPADISKLDKRDKIYYA